MPSVAGKHWTALTVLCLGLLFVGARSSLSLALVHVFADDLKLDPPTVSASEPASCWVGLFAYCPIFPFFFLAYFPLT